MPVPGGLFGSWPTASKTLSNQLSGCPDASCRVKTADELKMHEVFDMNPVSLYVYAVTRSDNPLSAKPAEAPTP